MKTQRFILLHAAAGLWLGAQIAAADVPNSVNSPVTGGIQLAGSSSGVTDSRCELDVTVRDAANNPKQLCTVTLHFGSCAGADLHLAATQSFPGMAFNCAAQTASAVTDAQGVARFRILGSASAGPGNPPGLTSPCVLVDGNGVILNSGNRVRLAAYDLDGANGVTAADEALFMSTLFASPAGYRERADYNGDGVCNSADLARIMGVLIAGGSVTSAASLCF